MRPWTLRPSVFDCLTISGQYGSPLCSSGVTTLTSARRPGEVGLTFTSGIASRVPLLRRREIDFLARGEPHVGLFPVAPTALDASEAARLALDVGHGHRVDLGLEHQLDRRLDLRLGRLVGDTEHVLAALLPPERSGKEPPRRPLTPSPTIPRFFFNDTATTEIYTLSLHDTLPISFSSCADGPRCVRSGAACP